MQKVTIKIEEDDYIYEYRIDESLTDQEIESFATNMYGKPEDLTEPFDKLHKAFIIGAYWSRDTINSRLRKETWINPNGENYKS